MRITNFEKQALTVGSFSAIANHLKEAISVRGQQGFLRAVEDKVNSLEKGLGELIRDMNTLNKREVLCAFYIAFGHPSVVYIRMDGATPGRSSGVGLF